MHAYATDVEKRNKGSGHQLSDVSQARQTSREDGDDPEKTMGNLIDAEPWQRLVGVLRERDATRSIDDV